MDRSHCPLSSEFCALAREKQENQFTAVKRVAKMFRNYLELGGLDKSPHQYKQLQTSNNIKQRLSGEKKTERASEKRPTTQ